MPPFNGAGVFVRLRDWTTDRDNSIGITDILNDSEDTNFAQGLSNILTKDGQTQPVADLPMATKKFTTVGNPSARTQYQTVASEQDGTVAWCGTASGTNTITASMSPAPTTLTTGLTVAFKSAGANTAVTTLNLNSLGAKGLYSKKSSGVTPVEATEIQSGAVIEAIYDGTQFQTDGVKKYTTNPTSWTTQTASHGVSAASSFLERVIYGSALYVAVGRYNGTSEAIIETSTDGATWTTRTKASAATAFNGIAYGNSTYVTVGSVNTGPVGKCESSSDGTTWTERTLTGFGAARALGVAYGNSLFVAVGESGLLSTSPDGTTWTSRTSSFGSTQINRVAYGNGLFVAVGASDKAAYSSDGITWTQFTLVGTINGIAYSDYAALWVAVGSSDVLYTSTDGVIWTSRTSGFSSNTIHDVAYGNGQWVAVANNGDASTSNDGTTWTLRSNVFGSDTIRGIAYSTGQFVAVGSNSGLTTPSIYTCP